MSREHDDLQESGKAVTSRMSTELIARHPESAPALIADDRVITYGELRDRVARTSAALMSGGVGLGDRVVVFGPNDVDFVVGLVATMAVGAVACPTPVQTPSEVLSTRVEALTPKAFVVSGSAADVGVQVAQSGLVEPALVGAPAGATTTDIPVLDAPGSPKVDVAATEPAVVLHTSGVIGAPRAAVLTHHNLLSAQDRLMTVRDGMDASAVALGVLPFAHVLGLNMVLLTHLRLGASVVLVPQFDAAQSLDLIQRHQVTKVVAVPPMWAKWVDLPDPPADAMRSVSFPRSGASVLDADVADAVHEIYGRELLQGYGLTETAGTVTIAEAVRHRPGSVGRPLPGVELQLVENGDPVEPGDRGEIWIKTPSVFHGYVDDPAGTAEVLTSAGWCRTGDVGIEDDDGALYLVGRSKDIVNVSGFNVAPVEVEAVLQKHPAITEASVTGEPDPRTGERVVAYVRAASPLDTDEVTEHCRRFLSGYKVPKTIHVVEELPKTDLGKRLRAELQ